MRLDLHLAENQTNQENDKIKKLNEDIKARLGEAYGYPLPKVLEENIKYIVTETFIAAKQFFLYDDWTYLSTK